MQHGVTLDKCPFRVPFYIHAKAPREQLLNKNHKHGSIPKEYNRNKYTSKNTGPPQDTIYCPRPKVNSFYFDDPYDHICHMENTHEDTHLIDTKEHDT